MSLNNKINENDLQEATEIVFTSPAEFIFINDKFGGAIELHQNIFPTGLLREWKRNKIIFIRPALWLEEPKNIWLWLQCSMEDWKWNIDKEDIAAIFRKGILLYPSYQTI